MAHSGSSASPVRVLFVCTGNICRSPLGEAIFKSLVSERGLERSYEVDSAGTHGWHEGGPADPRSIRVGERHGVSVTSVARALRADDFKRFDVLVAMDAGHLREMRGQCPEPLRHKLRLMRDYDRPGAPKDVPDPYYGGAKGFENVYAMLDVCCRGLLDALESEARPAAGAASPVA